MEGRVFASLARSTYFTELDSGGWVQKDLQLVRLALAKGGLLQRRARSSCPSPVLGSTVQEYGIIEPVVSSYTLKLLGPTASLREARNPAAAGLAMRPRVPIHCERAEAGRLSAEVTGLFP